jgi:hypothetical protein
MLDAGKSVKFKEHQASNMETYHKAVEYIKGSELKTFKDTTCMRHKEVRKPIDKFNRDASTEKMVSITVPQSSKAVHSMTLSPMTIKDYDEPVISPKPSIKKANP